MDSAVRRRMTLGFLSNWVSRLAGSIIQLVQLPVFLKHWSVPLYGEWIVLNTIPQYLAFSNIGFGNVAANDMTMLMGRDDKDAALRVFQSCWWLIVTICVAVTALFGVALVTLPLERWHTFHELSGTDVRWVLFALGTTVLFTQLEQLLGAAYTCVGKYPFGTFVKSVLSLGAFGIMLVPVMRGHGPRVVAVTYAAANLLGTVIFAVMAKRDVPWIAFGWRHARVSEVRRLFLPAFAFMGFPLSNAFNIQGTVLAVSWALGPVEVVVFSTARTVSRVALQMMQMVNQTFWPELSAAFGAGNLPLVRTLHRRACQMALIMGVSVIAAMMLVGPYFLSHWSLHKVPPSSGLLLLLMLSVLLYAGWSASSTLQTAINRHQRLALVYTFATGVTVVLTYFAARWHGLYAAAASLILSELIMDVYVLPASLRLTKDHWGPFLKAMLEVPAVLRPAALRRPEPALEGHDELEM